MAAWVLLVLCTTRTLTSSWYAIVRRRHVRHNAGEKVQGIGVAFGRFDAHAYATKCLEVGVSGTTCAVDCK